MNKKKKSTNISPYPDEAIERLARAFYPAILACWNSEEGQRSLVGARPLHLACARPFGRLKAPLGLSLLRCAAQTRACRVAGGTGSYCNQRKTGSSRWGTPCCTYRSCLWSLAGCVRVGAPCFCMLKLLVLVFSKSHSHFIPKFILRNCSSIFQSCLSPHIAFQSFLVYVLPNHLF
mgnify:CR=1 FL=1